MLIPDYLSSISCCVLARVTHHCSELIYLAASQHYSEGFSAELTGFKTTAMWPQIIHLKYPLALQRDARWRLAFCFHCGEKWLKIAVILVESAPWMQGLHGCSCLGGRKCISGFVWASPSSLLPSYGMPVTFGQFVDEAPGKTNGFHYSSGKESRWQARIKAADKVFISSATAEKHCSAYQSFLSSQGCGSFVCLCWETALEKHKYLTEIATYFQQQEGRNSTATQRKPRMQE